MRADADVLSSPRVVAHRPSGYTLATAAPTRAADLRELLKPGISTFVVVTAAAGYLLGAGGLSAPGTFAALLLGTALTAGGGGALNHLLEREHDAKMDRTRERPLPTGRLSPRFALAYGVGVSLVGFALLFAFVNALTGA
ncbi:MAG: UbiA family prenyltransferase, partial [Rhodothermales bacterium]|nr:UbiA family prenyltransferase [Rhodothermales bacterium]